MYLILAGLRECNREVPKFDVDAKDDEDRGAKFLLRVWALMSEWNEKALDRFHFDCTGRSSTEITIVGKIRQMKKLVADIFWAGIEGQEEAITLEAAKMWPPGFTTLKRKTDMTEETNGFGGKKKRTRKTKIENDTKTETTAAPETATTTETQEGTTMTTTQKVRRKKVSKKVAKKVATKKVATKKVATKKASTKKAPKAAKIPNTSTRQIYADTTKIKVVGEVGKSGVKSEIAEQVGKGSTTFKELSTKMEKKHKMAPAKLRGYLNWMKRSNIVEIS